MSLAIIPPETVEEILIHCNPFEISAFARTSRAHRKIVYKGGQHLWRSLLLNYPLDDPRNCVDHLDRPVLASSEEFDWRREVQRIVRARGVARKPQRARPHEAEAIFQTLLDVANRYARLDPFRSLLHVTANTRFLHKVLPSLLEYNGWQLSVHEEQMRGRLHTLYGLTRTDRKPESHLASRAFVYDLARYTARNDFGPFAEDGSGRVNWVHMRAIQHVVAMHVDIEQGANVVPGDFSAFACQPLSHISASEIVDSPVQDWAGVSGVWNVAFACCDQRALAAYNSTHNPAIFSHPHFAEIFSSVPFRLEVTEYEKDALHPDHPKIYFKGVTQHNTSTLEGHISLTADDLIRWHWISGDNGDRRWSTEGIHVGHVRGGFGMLGTWTSIFNAAQDFVGLTWITRSREM